MFKDLKNPKWADIARTAIILDALLEGGTEYEPFVASPNDCTIHGPSFFNFAVAGKFGPVADSEEELILRGEIEPWPGYSVINGQIINVAEREAEAQAELDRRLAELQTPETIARVELDEKFAVERKEKLKTLLSLKEQPGWPLKVKWSN